MMATKDVSVVLAHGAWADGSSWARVIAALKQESVKVTAAPLPLTTLADDVAALDRSETQIAAGETVPLEPVLDRLRASIARMKVAEEQPGPRRRA